MFIKLTNECDQLIYVNTDNIDSFCKTVRGFYTWIRFTGSEKELSVKEEPEQIMELINEHNEARL